MSYSKNVRRTARKVSYYQTRRGKNEIAAQAAIYLFTFPFVFAYQLINWTIVKPTMWLVRRLKR